jgi:translation elongation factor EF-1beta
MSNKDLYELTKLENVTAVTVFQEGGLDSIIDTIKNNVVGFIPNLETAAGRKEIASLAAKVSRSKTYLDALGKALVAGWKADAKKVDTERKRMRDTLDTLKADVRRPLTEWEEVENARIKDIQFSLELMQTAVVFWPDDPATSDKIKGRIAKLNAFDITEEAYQEFTEEAVMLVEKSLSALEKMLVGCIKHEADQAELERLRAEKEKRAEEERIAIEKKEREARDRRLRKEAAEKAKAQAEAKAKREREKIEFQKQQAIKDKEEAERREKEAAERAEREKQEAVEAERKRIEEKRLAEAEEDRKRQENEENRQMVHAEIASGFMDIKSLKLGAAQCAVIIDAIKKGNIPHLSIEY